MKVWIVVYYLDSAVFDNEEDATAYRDKVNNFIDMSGSNEHYAYIVPSFLKITEK